MLFVNAIEITPEQCESMSDEWERDNYNNSIPREQFWFAWNDGKNDWYEVIDNREGEFFVECFKTPEAAHAWLRDVDVDICYHIDRIIIECEEAGALSYAEYERMKELELY